MVKPALEQMQEVITHLSNITPLICREMLMHREHVSVIPSFSTQWRCLSEPWDQILSLFSWDGCISFTAQGSEVSPGEMSQ